VKNYIKPYLEDEDIVIEDIMKTSITEEEEKTIQDYEDGFDIGGM